MLLKRKKWKKALCTDDYFLKAAKKFLWRGENEQKSIRDRAKIGENTRLPKTPFKNIFWKGLWKFAMRILFFPAARKFQRQKNLFDITMEKTFFEIENPTQKKNAKYVREKGWVAKKGLTRHTSSLAATFATKCTKTPGYFQKLAWSKLWNLRKKKNGRITWPNLAQFFVLWPDLMGGRFFSFFKFDPSMDHIYF